MSWNNTELKVTEKLYTSALLSLDRQAAEKIILDAVQKGTDIKDIYLYVFQPSQYEIGSLWQANKITVAMEHFCTASTQFIMTRLYDYIFSNEKNGHSMVSTSVSGELHELGIRMVTDFFEMEGWNTYFLGANTPADTTLEMIKSVNADLFAISATIYFNIPQVKEMISFIRKNIGPDKLKILVGGNAFNMEKQTWKQVNADLYAKDANSAIDIANSLFKN